MQFELPFGVWRSRLPAVREEWLRVGSRQVPLRLVPNRRARRYVLRLRPDGVARVAIPRGGSAVEARRFAERNLGWLERQLLRQGQAASQPRAWLAGEQIFFRGDKVPLEVVARGENGEVKFGTESVRVKDLNGDLRPEIERHLRALASVELPARVFELAGRHPLTVARVIVRGQRSRWGSCSRRGTVSLNWKLVQVPVAVRDYIIWHELAHLKEMNHSPRFWREVARLCPEYEPAEAWLKANADFLR